MELLQQSFHPVLLELQLPGVIHVLELAAAAFPKNRTGRLRTPLRNGRTGRALRDSLILGRKAAARVLVIEIRLVLLWGRGLLCWEGGLMGSIPLKRLRLLMGRMHLILTVALTPPVGAGRRRALFIFFHRLLSEIPGGAGKFNL